MLPPYENTPLHTKASEFSFIRSLLRSKNKCFHIGGANISESCKIAPLHLWITRFRGEL